MFVEGLAKITQHQWGDWVRKDKVLRTVAGEEGAPLNEHLHLPVMYGDRKKEEV